MDSLVLGTHCLRDVRTHPLHLVNFNGKSRSELRQNNNFHLQRINLISGINFQNVINVSQSVLIDEDGITLVVFVDTNKQKIKRCKLTG